MNWINYAERKPEPEPKRQLLVKLRAEETVFFAAWTEAPHPWHRVTDWAEIEGPKQQRKRAETHPHDPSPWHGETPPAPDPFEEWWRC